jgi:dipeptidase
MRTKVLIFAVVLLPLALRGPQAVACYAIVVGRGASADGAVLVAHAEQNGGRRLLDFRRVPRQHFADDPVVRLEQSGALPAVKENWAFLWSEIPGTQFSDNFLSEWGVAVVSDYCPSREDDNKTLAARGEIRDGGIGYVLRRAVAERARTAREGVELAGKLIERFGYVDSGRTYVIADSREAWLLAVARGRHWVARRVPDDAVVLLPNVYVTDEVDLDDQANFLGSGDLVEYASRRGWFVPQKRVPFRFDRVYGAVDAQGPDVRRWRGQQLVTGRAIPWPPESLPFAVTPTKKLTVAALIEVLRGVIPADRTTGSPTQEGAVLQLRNDLPREIGCVYWRTSGEPSLGVLLPWYLGIDETPKNYCRAVDLAKQLSLAHHLQPPADSLQGDPVLAWWRFQTLQGIVKKDLKTRLPLVRRAWDALERRALADQPSVEKKALELWKTDPGAARASLSRHCADLAAEADRLAEKWIEQFGEKAGRD